MQHTQQAALTSKPCHHLQMFMVDLPEVFVVHPFGMAPVRSKETCLY